jgi:hypothetical protein
MKRGIGFRVLAGLILLGLIAIVTAGAYGAGLAAGSGGDAKPLTHGLVFGAGNLLGFLLTLFFLIVVLRLIAAVAFGGHRRRWHGAGGWGHPGFGPYPGAFGQPGRDDWKSSEWRDAGQRAFDEFHQRAHEAKTPTGPAEGDPR